MSENTKIQWCDSTVNPIMGCNGCELFPKPKHLLSQIDTAVAALGITIDSEAIFRDLIKAAYAAIPSPQSGHSDAVTTTNIWHLRDQFENRLMGAHGLLVADAAVSTISREISCYAARLHFNRGHCITDPKRKVTTGYAPVFEKVSSFSGRVVKAAAWDDLLGCPREGEEWKGTCPRMIFVGDMGDSFSAKKHFPFLKEELMPAIQSENGQRHLWLLLTKRPETMAEFSQEIGGFPDNVCAMTTVTSADPEVLKRVDQLRTVNAHIKGLSIEPLLERIPAEQLDLTGIDWVIVGGESGAKENVRPFALEWAVELQEHCQKHGVAFFMKQMGSAPTVAGETVKLNDDHGGDWSEWSTLGDLGTTLKVREFPQAFRSYRSNKVARETTKTPVECDTPENRSPKASLADIEEFQRQDEIVKRGAAAFIEVGEALAKIRDGELWKASIYKSWAAYCRSVAALSKSYANRLIEASNVVSALRQVVPIGATGDAMLPTAESQVRALLLLESTEQRGEAWLMACEKTKGQPTAAQVKEVVLEMLPEKDTPASKPAKVRASASPVQSPPLPTAKTVELVTQLREVVNEGQSWDGVKKILAEMEELISGSNVAA